MYQTYFGMKQRPFGATPHLGSYYPAAGQEEALATLRYCITQGRGVALVTGLAGTGKSLVCHRLTSSLESEFTTAMITNTNIPSVKALLQAILYDLALPYRDMDEQELRLTLTDFLLGRYAGGGRTVLIIDEAQNLTTPLLEELRMLGNLEGETYKLFQTVLAGHPRLLNILRQPELETLNQRIGARASLEALNDDETCSFIRHQLELAGVSPDAVFTSDAMMAVYEATSGIPRLINQVCEHAMLLAYVSEINCVDAEIVERASSDLLRLADPVDLENHATDLLAPGEDDTENVSAAEAMIAPSAIERPEIVFPIIQAEYTNDCREITDENQASDVPPTIITPAMREPGTNQEIHPLDETFDHEEIIVDRYAMMDAALSPRVPQSQPNKLTTRTAELPPANAVMPTMENSCRKDPAALAPAFVESTDNPAAHEVGAGVDDKPVELAEPPLLLIESGSQRVRGNLVRLDKPQPQAAREMGPFGRLFSHARKN